MTAPCAIEYILVTRWRGGKKGGQNRVCACDTRDRGVNKKLKPEHPSETVVMPESGERKRNLTTLVLVKNAAVKRSRSRQKVSESSQNPLSSSTFPVSTLSCWTVTACLSPFSRQQTSGRKVSLPGFHWDPERVSHSSIHCTEGVIL